MISELRSALASANDKIRNLETSKVAAEPIIVLPTVENSTIESVTKCLKCIENEEEKPVVTPEPLVGFPLLELKEARDAWSDLFHDRREIQHKLANLDQLEKEFQHKILLKNQKNDRIESIGLSTLR